MNLKPVACTSALRAGFWAEQSRALPDTDGLDLPPVIDSGPGVRGLMAIGCAVES
jgi:hypothetical protein